MPCGSGTPSPVVSPARPQVVPAVTVNPYNTQPQLQRPVNYKEQTRKPADTINFYYSLFNSRDSMGIYDLMSKSYQAKAGRPNTATRTNDYYRFSNITQKVSSSTSAKQTVIVRGRYDNPSLNSKTGYFSQKIDLIKEGGYWKINNVYPVMLRKS